MRMTVRTTAAILGVAFSCSQPPKLIHICVTARELRSRSSGFGSAERRGVEDRRFESGAPERIPKDGEL
jgi:hypothetical protein